MAEKLKYILLADDDTEDQDILKTAIEDADPLTRVQTVLDGMRAVKHLANCADTELPCLIILDYKMPLLNAAEVLEKLFGDARYRAIPKVVWSTSMQPEHIKQCLDKGAVQYFAKPNKASELALMVQQCLKYAAAI